jgi:hypothetical protein
MLWAKHERAHQQRMGTQKHSQTMENQFRTFFAQISHKKFAQISHIFRTKFRTCFRHGFAQNSHTFRTQSIHQNSINSPKLQNFWPPSRWRILAGDLKCLGGRNIIDPNADARDKTNSLSCKLSHNCRTRIARKFWLALVQLSALSFQSPWHIGKQKSDENTSPNMSRSASKLLLNGQSGEIVPILLVPDLAVEFRTRKI